MKHDEDILETTIEAPPAGPTWEERVAKQRAEWRRQDRERFVNPDFDPDLDAVWNVYQWCGDSIGWDKLGSVRKKPGRRKAMTMNKLFASLRRRFSVAANVPLKLISRQDDLARVRQHQFLAPPKHFETTASATPRPESLKIDKAPKQPVRRVRKDTSALISKRTKFVAWGALGGKWFFLGACESHTKRESRREIEKRFPVYVNPTILAVTDLKYALRNRVLSGQYVAGVTRMKPPL